MRRGRPVARIVLSPAERTTLEQYARRPTTAQALALRARIVLRCATSATHADIADDLAVTKQTVGKWRKRFAERRVAGLLDEPRPGAPRKISNAQIERAIATTLETTPRDATHWSTRTLAEREGLSRSAVARMWKAFALQPHRVETFKLSKDPLFIEKVRDIVGLYLHPPDQGCSVSMRRARFKPSIAPRPSCRCVLACRRGARVTMSATGRPRCLQPSTSSRHRYRRLSRPPSGAGVSSVSRSH